ncbi:glucosaminidase domain-containing protein [Streptococcaceae bacterium ESL0729]|nr:glucosaminidase domain-containing protein [Streptococcaceae bacterium ESL0729]
MANNKKIKKYISSTSLALILFSQAAPVLAAADSVNQSKQEGSKVKEEVTPAPAPVASSNVQTSSAQVPVNVEVPVVSQEQTPAVSEPKPVESQVPTSSEAPVASSESPSNGATSESPEASSTSGESSAEASSEQAPSSSGGSTDTQPSVPSSSTSESTSVDTSSSSEKPSDNNHGAEGQTPAVEKPSTGSDQIISKPASSSKFETEVTPHIIGPVKDSTISQDLLVDSITKSTLNGYELPLLTSLDNKEQAAIIVEALKQLNKPYAYDAKADESFNNLHLVNYVYEQVFASKLGDDFDQVTKSGEQVEVSKAQVGDILVWKDSQKFAIYLGNNKFIMADNFPEEPAKEVANTDGSAKTEEQKAQESKPSAVKIFTLNTRKTESKDKDTDLKYDNLPTADYAIKASAGKTLTSYGQDLVKNYAASMDVKPAQVTKDFIESIGDSARDLGQKYNVFASVMIAQAILESGSGSSGLARAPYNNLFGIKGSAGISSVVFSTQEDAGNGQMYSIQAPFRVYGSSAQSLEDYVGLIRNGISGNSEIYKGVWRSEAKNYLQATDYLTGRYATDTQYSNKLNSIIAAYNLTRFDEPKADPGVVIQDVKNIPSEYKDAMEFTSYNGFNYNLSGSYQIGQCTWYTYNRIKQLGGNVGDYMGNGGDWGINAMRLGYKTSTTPQAGYAISFKPGVAGADGTYGHVAFVEAVTPDGILVSESNVVNLQTVSYRVIPNEVALSSGVMYIAPK